MKKIKINFIGTGYYNLYQAKVNIYNENNDLVYQGKTYNGVIYVNLEPNKIYRLESLLLTEYINITFYTKMHIKEYTFIFENAIITQNSQKTNTVTFLLTDLNYKNLKIEKGEIVLWQKM